MPEVIVGRADGGNVGEETLATINSSIFKDSCKFATACSNEWSLGKMFVIAPSLSNDYDFCILGTTGPVPQIKRVRRCRCLHRRGFPVYIRSTWRCCKIPRPSQFRGRCV